MNKRQRRKIERERIIMKGLTDQQKASRYFVQQIDEIRACAEKGGD